VGVLPTPTPHGEDGARGSVDDASKNPLTLSSTGTPILPLGATNSTVALVVVKSETITSTAAEFAMGAGAVPGPQVPVHSGCVKKKSAVDIGVGRASGAMANTTAKTAIAIKFRITFISISCFMDPQRQRKLCAKRKSQINVKRHTRTCCKTLCL
jgi:hypothetical protein